MIVREVRTNKRPNKVFATLDELDKYIKLQIKHDNPISYEVMVTEGFANQYMSYDMLGFRNDYINMYGYSIRVIVWEAYMDTPLYKAMYGE